MQGDLLGDLEQDIDGISQFLTRKQENFDRVMQLSREIIRFAGLAITHMHNGERTRAESGLAEMRVRVEALGKIDADQKYHSMQAYQEYAEAFIFYNIKVGRRIPPMAEVGVDMEGYIMGLMDVEGELKREVMESLRAGDLARAEGDFEIMRRIYDGTRSIRFAEAVLGGFRKKQDVARIQLENAGGEILYYKGRAGAVSAPSSSPP